MDNYKATLELSVEDRKKLQSEVTNANEALRRTDAILTQMKTHVTGELARLQKEIQEAQAIKQGAMEVLAEMHAVKEAIADTNRKLAEVGRENDRLKADNAALRLRLKSLEPPAAN